MNLKSAVESILFVQGEPLAISRLIKITGAKKSEVEQALSELKEEYRERGIVLIQNGEEWQLATNSQNKEAVEKLITADLKQELSRPALEVLAIAAYKGPISRAGIEYIRGVDSTFSLRNLLMRGLVEREENPQDRRSYLYRISVNFLKYLGASDIRELPQYEELHEKKVEIPPSGEPDA